MNERDGLALGICNGFQALIKLGLVPYGKIAGQTVDSPTLTYNTIGDVYKRQMIRMAAENAHAEGKWIGICGELGADLELTEEFLKMGLDELSVSPSMVLPLRKKIRDCE